MTGDPARRFGIPDRGLVKSGFVADLVVFDPEGVMDNGTYRDPWRAPSGIVHVFVAGRPAVWDGAPLATTAGRVLTRDDKSAGGTVHRGEDGRAHGSPAANRGLRSTVAVAGNPGYAAPPQPAVRSIEARVAWTSDGSIGG